jgi:hypothetical protein
MFQLALVSLSQSSLMATQSPRDETCTEVVPVCDQKPITLQPNKPFTYFFEPQREGHLLKVPGRGTICLFFSVIISLLTLRRL